jgi:hypothetical protein
MKMKNLIILCAVLCILAGIVLVKQRTRPNAPSVDEEQDIIFSPLTLEGITEAVFRFGEWGKEARIVKEADGWKIQSLYGVDAEQSVLEKFLKQLDGLKGELRSDDAGLFADYGIAEGEGVHIILWESAGAYAFGLSATKIKNLLRGLGDLRARDVVSVEDAQEAFAGRLWRAHISLAEGDEIVVTRGAKTDDGQDYHVKVSGRHCFLVPVSVFDHFTSGVGDIFISNPLKVEVETVDTFEVQDLAAKKKFSMSKSAGKTEGGERVAWKTAAGREIEESKAKDIIQKFKGMDIHLALVDTPPAPSALAVKISSPQGTNTHTLTENKKFENGKECRFLKVAADPHAYCYPAAGVEGFQAAIPFPNQVSARE